MASSTILYRGDVARVLGAVACSSEGAALAVDTTDPALLQSYRQGVYNTLLSVGLAFGLEPGPPAAKDGKESARNWIEATTE